MDFLPPSGGVFRLSLLGGIAGYPMQTVMRFSRYGAEFGNKKSPHNNLNLTIPSGVALIRVRYVAIRKSKTCSGSFGSRAGTLSKYVILNCWNRLPQKTSFVNKKSENTLLSAECKKMYQKLWQKERGLDGASPLDIAIILKKGVATAGRGTYTVGSSASLRWMGGDRQLPCPPAHPSATEQVLAVFARSPFSASAGTKV